MPKKTKKEKLLAERRRSYSSPVATAVSFSLPAQPVTRNAAPAIDTEEFRIMNKSLLKTVIITAIILTSEFLLAHTLLNK